MHLRGSGGHVLNDHASHPMGTWLAHVEVCRMPIEFPENDNFLKPATTQPPPLGNPHCYLNYSQ